MNIKNYISSGIIEGYLFGLTTQEERLEFEQKLREDAELRAEFDLVQESLHSYVKAGSKPLPENFREDLWEKLEKTAQTPESNKSNIIENAEKMVAKQAPLIVRLMPFVAAASLALFSVSTYLAWDYHNKWQRAAGDVLALQNEKNKMANELTPLQTSNKSLAGMVDQFKKAGNHMVELKGKEISPSTDIMVCWNMKDHEVSLYNVASLPAAPEGKQYQLWAIVDGKPVNAGMIDEKDKDPMVPGHYYTRVNIAKAEAFAITLENAGGSEKPTMEAMYAIGNI